MLMRAVAALAGTCLLLLVAFIAAPAVVAGDPCYHGFDIPARSEGSETQIKVAPCAFAPTVSHIAVGGTVTFFNGPGFTHLITGANAEWGSKDVEVKPGQQVSYSFTKPGIYPYACALHRGMSGAIVVGDRTAAARAAPPAPAEPPADANAAAASANGSGSAQAAAQGLPVGQVILVGAGGVVVGGLAALGLIRSRTRRDQAAA
jgi:plastocyanin